MLKGGFHFIYNSDQYEATVAFYRDGLELPIIAAWDEGPEDRGTVFRAGMGVIEVLAHPTRNAESWKVYSPNLPRGVNLALEVDDVDGWYQRALEKDLPVKHEPATFNWGQRGFALLEPNGLVIFLYSPIVSGLEPSAGNLAD